MGLEGDERGQTSSMKRTKNGLKRSDVGDNRGIKHILKAIY